MFLIASYSDGDRSGLVSGPLEKLCSRIPRCFILWPIPSNCRDKAIADLVSQQISARARKIGDVAPDFSLPDARGHQVTLSQLRSAGPVILSFYRGAWCPFCNLELRGLQRALPEFQTLGASLVATSPQLPDSSLTRQEKHSLEFPVLSDVGNKVAKQYGIVFRVPDELLDVFQRRGVDLGSFNGQEGKNELPLPATFIVDSEGKVCAAFVQEDHTVRLDPEEITTTLRELRTR